MPNASATVRTERRDRLVPTVRVRAHLQNMTSTGGKTKNRIAAEAGVGESTVRRILAGTQLVTTPLVEQRLLDVKPASTPLPMHWGHVSSVEPVRILRGLFAQGWTWAHIGDQLGGVTPHAAYYWANHCGDWMRRSTVARIRAVASELGPHDIRTLPTPLPGMSWRSADAALKRDWPALRRWEGRDLTDPHAKPQPENRLEQVTDPDDPYSFIDAVLRRRVNAAVELILSTTVDDNKAAYGWIRPIGRLTRLEAHAVWWYAETAGLNDTHIARLLGYPPSDDNGSGQRRANRLRLKVLEARAWIESDPAGETPTWFTLDQVAGKTDFTGPLAALMAIQDAPFGTGWSVAELAKRCGVTEEDMRQYLTTATRVGNQQWQVRTSPRPRAVRHAETGGRCTEQATQAA